jgi:PHD/YefM family antitoxin component YafN of YafNO toxin-antitoxin module
MSKDNAGKAGLGVLFQKLISELDEVYGKYTRVNKMTARQNFAEVTNIVGYHKQRVLITNRDDPFVLMAPIGDLKKLDMLDEAGVTDEETLRDILEDYKKRAPKRRVA